MQLARTGCGGNTQGFLWFGFSAASGRFGLLMDVGLIVMKEEENRVIGEPQNGLGWKGT